MNFDQIDFKLEGVERVETDASLRARIAYVALDGHNPKLEREVATAAGHHLDDVAARFNLRRRRGKELGL